MPPNGRYERRSGSRIVSSSRPYISDRNASQTQGPLLSGSKRRQNTSLASAAARGNLRLSDIAAAVDGLKDREFGYWQTTNSVLGGASQQEHMGNSYNDLTSDSPVLIHLNNLHSVNGKIPPDPSTASVTTPIPPDVQQGCCHLLKAKPGYTPAKDGLCREFSQPETFAVNGVMQKQKRQGPHMYPQTGYPLIDAQFQQRLIDTPLVPFPNGKKIRWGGVDLTFRIEGALQDTQFDFYMVKCNKEKPMAWDPWHQTIPDEARSVPGVLPYTIHDFDDLHHPLYPKKLDTDRYTILSHRRVFVNNVNRITGQDGHNPQLPINLKYAGGGALPNHVASAQPTAFASTPATQELSMAYKPNKIVRPLRNFIGEHVNQSLEKRGTAADANPSEKATLGNMSWDNFHPSANVWLVMTTNHMKITTPKREGTTDDENWQAWVTAGSPTIREDQLQWHKDTYPENTENDGPNGKWFKELNALIYEREQGDLYRNPRIHIFRRTWWQDEHIPTQLTEAQRLTKNEAQFMTDTPTTPPTTSDAKRPRTHQTLADLEERTRTAARVFGQAANFVMEVQGVKYKLGEMFDMTGHDVSTWGNMLSAFAAKFQAGGVHAGVTPPTYNSSLAQLATDFRQNMGILDYFFSKFRTLEPLQKAVLEHFEVTGRQAMDVDAERTAWNVLQAQTMNPDWNHIPS